MLSIEVSGRIGPGVLFLSGAFIGVSVTSMVLGVTIEKQARTTSNLANRVIQVEFDRFSDESMIERDED